MDEQNIFGHFIIFWDYEECVFWARVLVKSQDSSSALVQLMIF